MAAEKKDLNPIFHQKATTTTEDHLSPYSKSSSVGFGHLEQPPYRGIPDVGSEAIITHVTPEPASPRLGL